MPSVSLAAAPDTEGQPSAAGVLFSVHARAEPGVMPRLIELFAKRGLVPRSWHSIRSGSALTIELGIDRLDDELAQYIARSMRQIVGVETVLTSAG